MRFSRILLGTLTLALAAVTACQSLPDIPDDECGNGVVDDSLGETCDAVAVLESSLGLPTSCAEPGTVGQCQYVWSEESACPDGFGYGIDQVCRVPTCAFEDFPVVTLPGDFTEGRVGDFDGDGQVDLVRDATYGSALEVVYFLPGGGIRDTLSLPLVGEPGIGRLGDPTTDTTDDVVLPRGAGVATFLGEEGPQLSPKTYATELARVALPVPIAFELFEAAQGEILPDEGSGVDVSGLAYYNEDAGALELALLQGNELEVVASVPGLPLSGLRPRVVRANVSNVPTDFDADPIFVNPHPLDEYLITADSGVYVVSANRYDPDDSLVARMRPPPGHQIDGVAEAADIDGPDEFGVSTLDLWVPLRNADGDAVVGVALGDGAGSFVGADDEYFAPIPLYFEEPGDALEAPILELTKISDIPFLFAAVTPRGVFATSEATADNGFVTGILALNFAPSDWKDAIAIEGTGSVVPPIVVSFRDSAEVEVLLPGASQFYNPQRFAAPGRLRGLVQGDFDGDGLFDVAGFTRLTDGDELAPCDVESDVAVLFGSASGFEPPVSVGALPGIAGIGVGRLLSPDALDSIDDIGIVAACQPEQGGAPTPQAGVLYGAASRLLVAPRNFADGLTIDFAAETAVAATVGRLVSDDALHLDVAVLGANGRVWVLDGSAEAELATTDVPLTLPRQDAFFGVGEIVAADLDECTDGCLDELLVLAPTFEGANVATLFVSRAPFDAEPAALEFAVEYGTAFRSTSLQVADVTGDGAVDVIAALSSSNGGTVAVFVGDGAGSVGPARLLEPPYQGGVLRGATVLDPLDGAAQLLVGVDGEVYRVRLGADGAPEGWDYMLQVSARDAGPGVLEGGPDGPVVSRAAEPFSLVTGDFDADGLPDLGVLRPGGTEIYRQLTSLDTTVRCGDVGGGTAVGGAR